MERFTGKLPVLGTCPICGREIRGYQYFYTTLPGEDEETLICKRCYNELYRILEDYLKNDRFVDKLIATYIVPILIANIAYDKQREEDIRRDVEEKLASKRRPRRRPKPEVEESSDEDKKEETTDEG